MDGPGMGGPGMGGPGMGGRGRGGFPPAGMMRGGAPGPHAFRGGPSGFRGGPTGLRGGPPGRGEFFDDYYDEMDPGYMGEGGPAVPFNGRGRFMGGPVESAEFRTVPGMYSYVHYYRLKMLAYPYPRYVPYVDIFISFTSRVFRGIFRVAGIVGF